MMLEKKIGYSTLFTTSFNHISITSRKDTKKIQTSEIGIKNKLRTTLYK